VGNLRCFVQPSDHQILHFEILNGYPSYEADCEYHFKNTGSIPFHVIGVLVDPDAGLTGCGADLDPDPANVIILCDQVKIGYFDNVGQQVDPGQERSGSLKVHVEQPARQSDCTATTEGVTQIHIVGVQCTRLVNYEFFIKVCVAQWNEAATYAQCVGSAQHEGPGSLPEDPDYDNIPTATDNCPAVFNPNQADFDGDLTGDRCDSTPDEDGAPFGDDDVVLG